MLRTFFGYMRHALRDHNRKVPKGNDLEGNDSEGDDSESDDSKGAVRYYMVVGGSFEGIAAVFAMMRWWCDGIQTVPDFGESTLFTDLFQLWDAAKILQVPDAMWEVIERRITEVTEEYIPSLEDLKAAYDDFDFAPGHPVRFHTVNAWAEACLDGCTDLEGVDLEDLFGDRLQLQKDLNSAYDRLRVLRGETESTAANVEGMRVEEEDEEMGRGAESEMDG